MKTYIVATNVEFTCLLLAESEDDAISAAKSLALEKGIDWLDELEFSAYTAEEYLADEENSAVQIHIEW